MFKYYIIIFITSSLLTKAQNINGVIKSKTGENLINCYVTVKETDKFSNIIEYSSVNKGLYYLKFKKQINIALVEVTANGYYAVSKILNKPLKDSIYIINFELEKKSIVELKEVIIQNPKKPFSVKEDTITFNVDKYKEFGDKKIQDIIKKLPGVEVNEKSGQIKYKGKPIEAVTLDGDDLFGLNYSLGTKNINIDMVEQIQAIDNYSANSLLKGIEANDKVSLNLKLKKGKTDYSGNIDFGLGISNNKNFLNNTNGTVISVSKKYKSFGILSYNNIGINHSPFDYFSNNQNAEQINEKNLFTKQVIPESLFSNIIDDERSNINSMFFSNYNSIFKINNRISIKTNIYFLNDKIDFEQQTFSENVIGSQALLTSDDNKTTRKPQMIRGDIEVKFNTSKKSLLEYKSKFSFQDVINSTVIIANGNNFFQSKLQTTNTFIVQNLKYTIRLPKLRALQFSVLNSFNKLPQILDLNNITENSKIAQKSEFLKYRLDANVNLLGVFNASKYSIMFGTTSTNTPFSSQLLESQNATNSNSITINQQQLYNQSSINIPFHNFTFIPSISVKILKQTIEKITKTDFLAEPTLFLKYSLNANSFLSTKIGFTQNPFSEEYFYSNPILTSNRLKISNTPSLEIQKTKTYNLGYYHNNLYKQFSAGFNVNYQENIGDFFADFQINENETTINNFFSNKGASTLSINANTEKFFSVISSIVKFSTTFSRDKGFNVLNNSEFRNTENNNLSNEFTIKTNLSKKIRFMNNLNYQLLISKFDDSNSLKNSALNNFMQFTCVFSKEIYANISNTYYLPNFNQKNNDYNFLDFSISYKPENKKYEINLMGKNLLNNRTFSNIQINDFSTVTNRNNLIARYIFLSLSTVF